MCQIKIYMDASWQADIRLIWQPTRTVHTNGSHAKVSTHIHRHGLAQRLKYATEWVEGGNEVVAMETSRKAEFVTDTGPSLKENQASDNQSQRHYYLLKEGDLNISRQISQRRGSRFLLDPSTNPPASQPSLTATTSYTNGISTAPF